MTADEAKTQLAADRLSRGLTQCNVVEYDAEFDRVLADHSGDADAAYAACVQVLDEVLAAVSFRDRSL